MAGSQRRAWSQVLGMPERRIVRVKAAEWDRSPHHTHVKVAVLVTVLLL